jgi:diaminopimelate decarboxylase
MTSWPLTAQPAVSVGEVRLAEIAERFGTPACVLDEEHVRVRCREYVKALAQHEVAYAAGHSGAARSAAGSPRKACR